MGCGVEVSGDSFMVNEFAVYLQDFGFASK